MILIQWFDNDIWFKRKATHKRVTDASFGRLKKHLGKPTKELKSELATTRIYEVK